jgi:hypothetical protein
MYYMEDSVFLRRMLLKCTLENHDVVYYIKLPQNSDR